MVGSQRQGARVGLDFIKTSQEHPEDEELSWRRSRCDCQANKGLCPCPGKKRGFTMQNHRLFVAALLLVISIGLGGCFHHAQAVAAEPLPPPVTKPLK